MKNTIKIQTKNTKIIAHRGLSGLERENTCRAFIAAGNREKYFGIETDVHRTIDGKYVTIHDDVTGRVSKTNIEIAKSTLEEVRNIILTDIDGRTDCADIRIPTLEEYITICKRYQKTAVLELKCNFSEAHIKEIIEIIKNEDYLENVVFISFFREALVIIRRLLPKQKIQYLSCEFNEEILSFMKENALDFDVLGTALNEENIKLIKSEKIEINAWTIDDPALAQKLIDLGVDYITTNILE